MTKSSVKANCRHCGENLAPNHIGPCPSCGKTGKNVSVTIQEIIEIRDNIETLVKKDPLTEIKKAGKERDYFKAITYTTSVLELYGKQVLAAHFTKRQTKINPKKLERTSLESIIIMLYTNGLIDHGQYAKMMEIKNARNKFIHGNYSIKQPSSRMQEWEKLVPKCVDVVKILKNQFDALANL